MAQWKTFRIVGVKLANKRNCSKSAVYFTTIKASMYNTEQGPQYFYFLRNQHGILFGGQATFNFQREQC
uniref:Uncharacterized protein n=1 Tax=Triticum urartu TaxID=4572 RepID=A0A8R7Q108_TRIUA